VPLGCKISLGRYRPVFELRPTDETEEEQLERLVARYKALTAAYNKLLTEADAKEPFYPASLYDAIQECIVATQFEMHSIEKDARAALSFQGHMEAEAYRKRYSKGYRAATSAIRDRIATLAILPS
jgi:hypothetical protein